MAFKATSMTLDKFCKSWMTEPIEWSVELTIGHVIPEDELVDAVDDLLEDLAPRDSCGPPRRGTQEVKFIAKRSASRFYCQLHPAHLGGNVTVM